MSLGVKRAKLAMDEQALRVWEKAGARTGMGTTRSTERQDSTPV